MIFKDDHELYLFVLAVLTREDACAKHKAEARGFVGRVSQMRELMLLVKEVAECSSCGERAREGCQGILATTEDADEEKGS